MRVYDNGFYRDATPEEIAAHEETTRLVEKFATAEDYKAALRELGVEI